MIESGAMERLQEYLIGPRYLDQRVADWPLMDVRWPIGLSVSCECTSASSV